MAGGKFNPFLKRVEVKRVDWFKNKESRYVRGADGKIMDTVVDAPVHDELQAINEINDANVILFRAYSSLVLEASKILKGAPDHSALAANLEKFKYVRDQYETRS